MQATVTVMNESEHSWRRACLKILSLGGMVTSPEVRQMRDMSPSSSCLQISRFYIEAPAQCTSEREYSV